MISGRANPLDASAAFSVHLLGTLDYSQCLALQERLVYETSGRRDGQITLLVVEHPPLVTLGRQGSLGHIHWPDAPRRDEPAIEQKWVARGGGAMLHAPGQVALYPIVPLAWHGWRVGDYLRRLQTGLAGALAELGVTTEGLPDRFGLWGRSGQVVAIGIAVKLGIALHGAWVNVDPPLRQFRAVQVDPEDSRPMGSLAADLNRPVRMPAVREALFRHLAEALECARVHVFSGHPLLAAQRPSAGELARRVG